jgi:hypothetical protein
MSIISYPYQTSPELPPKTLEFLAWPQATVLQFRGSGGSAPHRFNTVENDTNTAQTANHEIIRQVITEAGSKMVSVTFIKQDGSERQLTFNPRHKGQILGTGNPIKDPEKAKNVFRIMDINLNEWRSFDARRVYRVKFQGKTVDLPTEE